MIRPRGTRRCVADCLSKRIEYSCHKSLCRGKRQARLKRRRRHPGFESAECCRRAQRPQVTHRSIWFLILSDARLPNPQARRVGGRQRDAVAQSDDCLGEGHEIFGRSKASFWAKVMRRGTRSRGGGGIALRESYGGDFAICSPPAASSDRRRPEERGSRCFRAPARRSRWTRAGLARSRPDCGG